jgi:hypothetical protein
VERQGHYPQGLNTKGFQRLPDIMGEDANDTASLLEMATSARDYITSFNWCPPINAGYLASGVGSVVAVFLFEFASKIQDTDDRLWVIVGDLPSAYLVVEPEDSPPDALERYCSLMEDWIAAIRDSTPLDEVFPVAADPIPENAESLEKRIAFLLAEIIPRMAERGS